jgi:hypothetical protein
VLQGFLQLFNLLLRHVKQFLQLWMAVGDVFYSALIGNYDYPSHALVTAAKEPLVTLLHLSCMLFRDLEQELLKNLV